MAVGNSGAMILSLLNPLIGTRCLACLILLKQNTHAAGRTIRYAITLRKYFAYLSLKCGPLGELSLYKALCELGLLYDAPRRKQVGVAKLFA